MYKYVNDNGCVLIVGQKLICAYSVHTDRLELRLSNCDQNINGMLIEINDILRTFTDRKVDVYCGQPRLVCGITGRVITKRMDLDCEFLNMHSA